jgi:hypothetical protein
MATKRQQTMAKVARERAVREKRERKLEKKRLAKAERKAGIDGSEASDTLLDSHQPDGDDGAVLGEGVVSGL